MSVGYQVCSGCCLVVVVVISVVTVNGECMGDGKRSSGDGDFVGVL